MRNKYLYLVLIFSGITLVIHSCKKDEPAPHNPYDDVNYGGTTQQDTLDPYSITSLHKTIFAVKCANPGCHDGNFEPDYRTEQSTYATLVYHPVVKQLDPWHYRVIPHDTAASWLWQRINHSTIVSGSVTCSGRMPLYAPQLTKAELNRISTWILNGAKDMFNQLPVYPNTEPMIGYYGAVNSTYQAIDTNRAGGQIYNPFKVPSGTAFKIGVLVNDDSTAVSSLIHNKLKMSTNKDVFTSATIYTNCYYVASSNGKSKFWIFDVSTSPFVVGDTVYFRYYTNDGDHVNDTEFPRNDHVIQYKTWWSFVVQ